MTPHKPTLWSVVVIRRLGLLTAIVSMVMLLGAIFVPGGEARADSNRCPADKLDPDTTTDGPEKVRISNLWKMLHGPGLDGGDGPLGCPVGKMQKFDDPDYVFRGLGQQFQRGWIFVAHGDAGGNELAVVRGMGVWTVWTKGITGVLPGMISTQPGSTPFGGTVTTFRGTGAPLTLIRCDPAKFEGAGLLDLEGCVLLIPGIM
jgi:hypothetical protein